MFEMRLRALQLAVKFCTIREKIRSVYFNLKILQATCGYIKNVGTRL